MQVCKERGSGIFTALASQLSAPSISEDAAALRQSEAAAPVQRQADTLHLYLYQTCSCLPLRSVCLYLSSGSRGEASQVAPALCLAAVARHLTATVLARTVC